MYKIITSIIILSLLVLAGCTSKLPAKPDLETNSWPEVGANDQKKSWWYIQFVKQWPGDSPSPFHYDVMLAEQVIRPVLISHNEKIDLWRFHRRAARDAAGSKFSFIFYARAEDARIIADHILSDPLVIQLRDKKLVEKIWVDDFNNITRPKLSDTSDPVWPVEIQNSWPYFIMGVSQSWLALIHEFTSRQPLDFASDSVDEIIEYYAGVTADLDRYWKENGAHAYIHHLSALFGYRPVEMRF